MKAIARSVRITPKKLNLIADVVRNRKANEALTVLKFMPKKGARLLAKVIRSAVANAENNFKQASDSLFIKEIVVTKAPTMKRSVPISRGRVYPILKRSAHVMVMVGVMEEKKSTKKKDKSVSVSEVKPEVEAEQTTTAETKAKKKSAPKKATAKTKTTTKKTN